MIKTSMIDGELSYIERSSHYDDVIYISIIKPTVEDIAKWRMVY